MGSSINFNFRFGLGFSYHFGLFLSSYYWFAVSHPTLFPLWHCVPGKTFIWTTILCYPFSYCLDSKIAELGDTKLFIHWLSDITVQLSCSFLVTNMVKQLSHVVNYHPAYTLFIWLQIKSHKASWPFSIGTSYTHTHTYIYCPTNFRLPRLLRSSI